MESIKVLVADNYPEFTNLLEEYISGQQDMEVVGVAYNGYEVLEILDVHSPDVVILDVLMPVLDGIGVLEKLQATMNGRPEILMLSSVRYPAIIDRALELGATGFIFKPCDLHMIVQQIRKLKAYDVRGLQVS